MTHQQKLNEGRKARAAARRLHMQTLAAQGQTDKQIAEEVGMAEQTVRNNLVRARKEGLTVTEQDREGLVDELLRIKADVEAHRKSDGKMPLQGVDRLIKIAEVIARIKLPTRSENLSVTVTADPAAMGMYNRFLHECGGLTPAQFESVWLFMRALPRQDVPLGPPDDAPTWHFQSKQLPEGEL